MPPVRVSSSTAHSRGLPTKALARAAAPRSNAPPGGTPHWRYPGRPASWTVVLRPASMTIRPILSSVATTRLIRAASRDEVFQFQIPDPRFQIQDSRSKIPDPRFQIIIIYLNYIDFEYGI